MAILAGAQPGPYIILAPLGAGGMDKAIALLNCASEERNSVFIVLTSWPICKRLREDDRCEALLAEVGLPYQSGYAAKSLLDS